VANSIGKFSYTSGLTSSFDESCHVRQEHQTVKSFNEYSSRGHSSAGDTPPWRYPLNNSDQEGWLYTPIWLHESALWIKVLIVLSTMIIMFSFAIIVVGISFQAATSPGHYVQTGGTDEFEFKLPGREIGRDIYMYDDSAAPSPLLKRSVQPTSVQFNSGVVVKMLQNPTSSPTINRKPSRLSTKNNQTLRPVLSPTAKPTTKPDASQTANLVAKQTTKPTENIITSPPANPAESPAANPSANSTAAPHLIVIPISDPYSMSPDSTTIASPASTSFFITSDLPDDEDVSDYEEYLSKMGNADFMVHLGNFNYDRRCREGSYEYFSNLLEKYSPIPVFLVNGDKEWISCPSPELGFQLWTKWLLNIDRKWEYNFEVSRQAGYEDNFSFLNKRVLYIGLRIVVGSELSEEDMQELILSNVWWVKEQFAIFSGQFELVSLFGNDGYNKNRNKDIFDTLNDAVKDLGVRMLYFHESDRRFKVTDISEGNSMVSAVSIRGGRPRLTKVTITPSSEIQVMFSNE